MRLMQLCLLSLALLFCVAGFAADIPPLKARVTDLTDSLGPVDASTLENTLATHEQSTGNQIAVLVIPSLEGESIEGYAVRVFEEWKLGQKGKDNGVLFVIAKNDRKMRIEVGYGLEGVIPDVVAARIIRDRVAPYFASGNFPGGVHEGVNQLIAAITGEAPDWEERQGISQVSSDEDQATDPEVAAEVVLVWASLVLLTFILLFSGAAIGGRIGGVVCSFGMAAFFGTFISIGMLIFHLDGSWPEMRWWWQYLPTLALGTFFSLIGVGSKLDFIQSSGSGGYSGSSGGFSSSRSSSGSRSSGFSGGGGRSGGGGASGSW